MGEENFPELIPFLLTTLKSDQGTVDRTGAAQGAARINVPARPLRCPS